MNHANDPNDPFETVMKVMFWFVITYFVVFFIPQVLIKLVQ